CHSTSQAIMCFCTLKSHPAAHQNIASLSTALSAQIRAHIGPFATPKRVIIVTDLPKTRSGKIMRRILRKVAAVEITVEDMGNEEKIRMVLGDISTLADPSVVAMLVEKVAEKAR